MLTRRSLLGGSILLPLLRPQHRGKESPHVPYKDFGTPGKVTAALDTTGQNTGNLTSEFIPVRLGLQLSQFVIYHMVLENLTVGMQARITQNANTYGYFGPATGTGREWFGQLHMKSGDELRFLWNTAPNGPPVTNAPGLTCYIVYDPDLPGNSGLSA